jgi:hypothetical protein
MFQTTVTLRLIGKQTPIIVSGAVSAKSYKQAHGQLCAIIWGPLLVTFIQLKNRITDQTKKFPPWSYAQVACNIS